MVKPLHAALCAVAIGLALPAAAEPPARGISGMFSTAMVFCDTQEEIEAIVEAGRDAGAKVRDKFDEYAALINAAGEAACIYGVLAPAVIGEAVALGASHALNNAPIQAWAVHVTIDDVNGWVLYAEPIKPAGVAI